MTDVLWWIVGLYLAVGTALLIVNGRPHAQESALLRFQGAVGVDLPQRLAERLRRRMLTNRRSRLIGGMVGILVSAVIVSSRAPSVPTILDVFILITGALAGPAVATSISALLTASDGLDDEVRIARSHAVALRHYVPLLERLLARGLSSLAIGIFAASSISSGPRPADDAQALMTGALLTLMVIATLLIFEIAGRRIVAMGNRAGSPEDLVWEDAIRSLVVRDLASAPVLVGLYAILWSAPALVASDGDQEALLYWIGLIVAFGVVAAVGIGALRKPESHFLRKLWPELASGAGAPRSTEPTS